MKRFQSGRLGPSACSSRTSESCWPLATLVLALVVLLASSSAVLAEETETGEAPDLYSAILDEQRSAVIAETEDRLTKYTIAATITPATDDEPATISGLVTIDIFNDTFYELEALHLRLYANDDEYADGEMTLETVELGGTVVEPELSVDDTVATLPLIEPLAPEDRLEVMVAFGAVVPTDPDGSYGMFSTQEEYASLTLAHWYPVLAGHGPDGQPNLDPPSENGDPIFTNTALYDLSIALPQDMELASTGTEVNTTEEGDRIVHHIVTGPVRDVILVADPTLEVLDETVDGTVVRSWYQPEDRSGGERVLEYGVAALTLFNDLFGPYPYDEMDLVEVPIGNGAAGVEFPQLMLIGADYYDDRDDPDFPGFLEDVVAHEVAHQWWYALVGNNQYEHAYIDEGLTNYASTYIYFTRVRGEEVGELALNYYLKLPYLMTLFSGGDAVVDQPTDDFESGNQYGVIVYSKAALGFHALRQEIGDDAFFAALQAYLAEYRFEVATPEDLRRAFEAASGLDLREFWRHWFEAAEGNQDFSPEDLEEVEESVT